jgi:3-hydroxy-3-methylglutaryl CoA synthase
VTVIDGHGGYVPLYRVERSAVAEQYGGAASGESAVPARDENHVTMASEAATTALARSTVSAAELTGVLAASVTDRFAEHGVAAQVGYRLGATGDVRTGDFRGTTRATTDALDAARSFADGGGGVLVVAVDVMPADPADDGSPDAGAGAAAFVVREDADDPVATVEGVGAETTGFVERHREHGSVAETGDARFERRHGVRPAVEPAIERALDGGRAPDRAVAGAPSRRLARTALQGVDCGTVSTFDSVGFAGCAGVALDLAHLLEGSEAGESVLAVNYGAGGADALALRTGGGVERRDGPTVDDLLASKEHVSYAKHLEYREPVDYQGVSGA